MGKQFLNSATVAALLVGLLFGALILFPYPTVGRVVVAAGFPLGELLIRILPSGIFYELAPEGGATVAAFIFGVSSLLTWFLLFWGVCFAIFGHMRSHSLLKFAPFGRGTAQKRAAP